MKIKTQDLTGPALDWAVERSTGTHWSGNGYFVRPAGSVYPYTEKTLAYSTDWAHGGPIIEQEKIAIEHRGDSGGWRARIWVEAAQDFLEVGHRGAVCPTPLIAAMRCYVASKLGDEIEIPKELIKD